MFSNCTEEEIEKKKEKGRKLRELLGNRRRSYAYQSAPHRPSGTSFRSFGTTVKSPYRKFPGMSVQRILEVHGSAAKKRGGFQASMQPPSIKKSVRRVSYTKTMPGKTWNDQHRRRSIRMSYDGESKEKEILNEVDSSSSVNGCTDDSTRPLPSLDLTAHKISGSMLLSMRSTRPGNGSKIPEPCASLSPITEVSCNVSDSNVWKNKFDGPRSLSPVHGKSALGVNRISESNVVNINLGKKESSTCKTSATFPQRSVSEDYDNYNSYGRESSKGTDRMSGVSRQVVKHGSKIAVPLIKVRSPSPSSTEPEPGRNERKMDDEKILYESKIVPAYMQTCAVSCKCVLPIRESGANALDPVLSPKVNRTDEYATTYLGLSSENSCIGKHFQNKVGDKEEEPGGTTASRSRHVPYTNAQKSKESSDAKNTGWEACDIDSLYIHRNNHETFMKLLAEQKQLILEVENFATKMKKTAEENFKIFENRYQKNIDAIRLFYQQSPTNLAELNHSEFRDTDSRTPFQHSSNEQSVAAGRAQSSQTMLQVSKASDSFTLCALRGEEKNSTGPAAQVFVKPEINAVQGLNSKVTQNTKHEGVTNQSHLSIEEKGLIEECNKENIDLVIKKTKSLDLGKTLSKRGFFGTPIASHKRVHRRSKSQPSTFKISPVKEGNSDLSPASAGSEFKSPASSISPFSNIVGNVERPSIVPMTPGMRNQVNTMKRALDDQLNLLFN